MNTPATTLIDDFNRANETPLAGPNWQKNGNSGANINLTGNGIKSSGAGPTGAFRSDLSLPPEQEVWCTITTLPASGQFMSLLFNLLGTAGSATWSSYAVAYVHGAPGQIVLQAINNPTVTTLGTWNITLAAGDKLLGRQKDGIIYAYYFSGGVWTLAGSVADTTYQRTGF